MSGETLNSPPLVPEASLDPSTKIVDRMAISFDALKQQRRLAKLFEPVSTGESDQVDVAENNYADLFAMSDEEANELQKAEIGKVGSVERPGGESYITEQSEADGRRMLSQVINSDEGLEKIFREEQSAYQIDYKDMQTWLRNKADFRIAVGTHLLDKLDKLAKIPFALPARVVANQPKKPDDYLGDLPADMTSREWTARLALSMIDGTFNSERSSADPITRNEFGEVIVGQHRAAAIELLTGTRLNGANYNQVEQAAVRFDKN